MSHGQNLSSTSGEPEFEKGWKDEMQPNYDDIWLQIYLLVSWKEAKNAMSWKQIFQNSDEEEG